METKKWYLSKRFWGIVVCVVGKVLPMIKPELQPLADQVLTVGGVVFGAGCLLAKSKIGL